MALVYLTMPKEITRLYFADLVGAATATLILDPLMRNLGAESVLISIDLLVIGPLASCCHDIHPDRKKMTGHNHHQHHH